MYRIINLIPVFSPLFDGEDPFGGTSSFQRNFFFGGIGLWFVFFLLALIALIWVFFDSQKRNLDATAWRFAVIVALILVLPALMFKFTVTEDNVDEYFLIRSEIANLERYEPDGWIDEVDRLDAVMQNDYPPLTGYIEWIIYLGLVGGIGGVGIAVAYYITFQGNPGGSSVRGSMAQQSSYVIPEPPPAVMERASQRSERNSYARPMPQKDKANAWLVTEDGKSYQLNVGTTVIGRSSRCDIQVSNDTTVSKEHAKLIQQSNGTFKLIDLGSTNGTKVNGRKIREIVVDPNDKIQFGDNTVMRLTA